MHEHERCMNCGAGLKGPYCHVCGQRDDDFRRPFLALGNEFIGDVFAFDSRIFRSVPPFLFAPGMLTRSFMKGKRGKYVSPLRLYFVLTLIFFTALAATNVAIFKIRVDADRLERFGNMIADDDASANLRLGPDGEVVVGLDTDAEEARDRDRRDRAEKLRKSARERAEALKAEIRKGAGLKDGARAEAAGTPAGAGSGAEEAPGAAKKPARSADELEDRLWNEFGMAIHIAFFSRIENNENFEGLPKSWKEKLAKEIDGSDGTEADKTRLRRYLKAGELALENPRAFNQVFNTWIPRILIVIVPLFAMITSFLYGRKKRLPRPIYYIDHLVFSIYFHAFLFFLMLLLVLKAEWVGNVWDGSLTARLFFLAVAAYLFIGMKQAFGQGYFKTTIKFAFLYSFYFVTLAIALFAVVIVGLFSLPVTS